MKNHILISVFACLLATTGIYSQDKPPTGSNSGKGERTSCIQSPDAAKNYIEKQVDKTNKQSLT